jgi:hypothetical protein
MYRREAIEGVGLFDEFLVASEDVDLAWRVVLDGWVLAYEESASVVHHDGNSWRRFLRKGWTYGRGAAQLTHAYAPHGVRGDFKPRGLRRESWAETVSNFYYWAGFTFQRWRRQPLMTVRHVADIKRFRDPFRWTNDQTLRVSPRAVYWFREKASIVVQVDRHQRTVLDHVGDFIWRQLVAEKCRNDVTRALVEHYGVADVTAASDLDELIEELVASGILDRTGPVVPVK